MGRIRARPDIREAREAAFPNRQELDFDGLLGRAWSSSYVVHGVKDKAAFDGDLRRAFDRHERNAVIDIVYRTEVIAWSLR